MKTGDEAVNRLKSFITSRSGLYFKDHDLKGLEDVISARMKEGGFDNPVSYYSHLTSPDSRDEELRELLNRLTINHTYFFRNEPQFKALREKILPEVMARKSAVSSGSKPVIRIWSAGCSTGEEPYTIAMVLKNAIPDIENWDIHILATDASQNALAAARSGIYNDNSVKNVDAGDLERYFIIEGEHNRKRYRVRDEIKDMVTFGYFNMMDDEYPALIDILFCRNVTIYFELETTLKVMNKIHSAMDDKGYLFIGYSETLHFMRNKFEMVNWGEAIYYRKAGSGQPEEEPAASPLPEEPDIDEILKEISKEELVADVSAAKEEERSSPATEELLVEIIKAIHTKEYSRAMTFIDKTLSIDKSAVTARYLKAEILLNQGRFDEARLGLLSILQSKPMFAPAYYLLGCMHLEKGDSEKAKESFKKALYIDHDFMLAHFYMAQAFRDEGRIQDAIREYRNTIKVLSKSLSYDIIAYSGGFEAATLLSICRDNIERLKFA